jgi:hypothetical protein
MEWNDCKIQAPKKEALCLIHVTYGGVWGYDEFILGMPDLENNGFACGDEMIYSRCNQWLPFVGNIDFVSSSLEIVDLKWAYIDDIDQALTIK